MVVGRAALQRHVVLHVRARAEHLVYIIDVVPSVRRVTVEHGLNIFAREDGLILRAVGNDAAGKLVHHVGHIVIVGKLGAVHELGEIRIYRHAVLPVVAHPRASLAAFLGGDDDHAAARVQSVHGSRGTVLEHGYRLDVVRVDVVNASWHAVNHVKHAVFGAADAQRCLVGPGFTRCLHRRDAGHAAAQQARHVRRRRLQQFVAAHGRDGSRERGLARLAVSDDDNVVQHRLVVSQLYINIVTASHRHRLGRHAHIGKYQLVAP